MVKSLEESAGYRVPSGTDISDIVGNSWRVADKRHFDDRHAELGRIHNCGPHDGGDCMGGVDPVAVPANRSQAVEAAVDWPIRWAAGSSDHLFGLVGFRGQLLWLRSSRWRAIQDALRFATL